MIILTAILLVLLMLVMVIYLNAFYAVFLSVPSLSSRNKIIKKLFNNIDFGKNKKFYDLGSGTGHLIAQVADRHPDINCIGVEYNVGIYWLALLRNKFAKQKVTYRRENFYKTNLEDADIIFAYLTPALMQKLEMKLKQELKAGTLVISNSFPIKTRIPIKIIPGSKGKLDTLYIYQY